jgi:mRNA-degrading endonuclease toxin of MazEF toxin-antitoxin module
MRVKGKVLGIRWADLNKYSLVWVEFGNRKDDLDCDDINSYSYGLNMGHEFCYRHMAIVVSSEVYSDEIVVVPLTTYKRGDENYPSNIVIDVDKYGYMVQNKTTIKINHLRSIDKRKRVKKIIKPFISKTLKLKINEVLLKSIG